VSKEIGIRSWIVISKDLEGSGHGLSEDSIPTHI
jgi:hypothetical protein